MKANCCAYAVFEQKPVVFGRGVMGLRGVHMGAFPIPVHEWEEFKPFLCFRAMDSFDFWERFSAAVRACAPPGPFDLRACGVPFLDELLADELLDLEDAAREQFWRDMEARLTAAAERGQAFAQKLLGDYYGRLREGGRGGDVGKALRWYAEAEKSGIIDLNAGEEAWEEEEFDEEIEPFPDCGAYSSDPEKERSSYER